MSQHLRPYVTLTDNELKEIRAVRDQHRVHYSIIVRQALRVWLFLMRARRAGDQIEIHHQDGSKHQLEIFL